MIVEILLIKKIILQNIKFKVDSRDISFIFSSYIFVLY